MLGLWAVKQSCLVFCCASHQTRAVGYFCFYRENRPMTSAVYFNCRSTLTAGCYVLTRCIQQATHEYLLCAGHEGGRLDPLSAYKASHLGTRDGAGEVSERCWIWQEATAVVLKEVADALSLEEETWKIVGISKGERRGCPRQWELCVHRPRLCGCLFIGNVSVSQS